MIFQNRYEITYATMDGEGSITHYVYYVFASHKGVALKSLKDRIKPFEKLLRINSIKHVLGWMTRNEYE